MRKVFLAAALCCVAAAANAETYRVGEIAVIDPWSRATPPRAPSGVGYMRIQNDGAAPDRLRAATCDCAGETQMHLSQSTGGVMRMEHLDEGVDIAAGETAEFGPGGLHVMFMRLKAPLVAGTPIVVKLTFDRAGDIEVLFDVRGRK